MCLNVLQASISPLLVCVTAMINHVFMSFSAVQIFFDLSYIHLCSNSTQRRRTCDSGGQLDLGTAVSRELRRWNG